MGSFLASLTRTQWLQLAAISAVLSFCCVFGISYTTGEGFATLSLPVELLLTGLGIVPFALVILVLNFALDSLGQRTPRQRGVAFRHPALVTFAVILLCWLPWLIANFPGSSYWDTYWQMWQVYPDAHPVALIQWAPVRQSTLTDAWLVDHHPVLTTLLFGGAAWLSDQLTGTWMAGVFVLSTLQTLAYAALFAGMLRSFRRWGTPRWARMGILAFLCLIPAVPTWASCVVKDSVFGLFFLPWSLMLANCARTRGRYLTTRRIILFVVLALLMCLTKKTGIFIVGITTVVACVLFWKRKPLVRAFAWQGATCLAVMTLLLPLIIFPLANISPGGKQEILGPLFQQTARYAQAHELTPEEAQVIDAVVDVERVREHYQFDFQDGVKYYYRVDSTPADLGAYLELYAAQGIQDPEAYFAAIASQAGMYVAPTTFLNIRMVTVDTKLGEEDRPVLWNPPELDWLRKGLDELYGAIASIPVLNLPFLTVVYVLWIPAVLLFANLRKHLGLGVLFVPLGVVVGFCVIAPVFDARYVWPMLLAAPVLLAACTGTPLRNGPEAGMPISETRSCTSAAVSSMASL